MGHKLEEQTLTKQQTKGLNEYQVLFLQHFEKLKAKVTTLSQIKEVIDKNMDFINLNGP